MNFKLISINIARNPLHDLASKLRNQGKSGSEISDAIGNRRREVKQTKALKSENWKLEIKNHLMILLLKGDISAADIRSFYSFSGYTEEVVDVLVSLYSQVGFNGNRENILKVALEMDDSMFQYAFRRSLIVNGEDKESLKHILINAFKLEHLAVFKKELDIVIKEYLFDKRGRQWEDVEFLLQEIYPNISDYSFLKWRQDIQCLQGQVDNRNPKISAEKSEKFFPALDEAENQRLQNKENQKTEKSSSSIDGYDKRSVINVLSNHADSFTVKRLNLFLQKAIQVNPFDLDIENTTRKVICERVLSEDSFLDEYLAELDSLILGIEYFPENKQLVLLLVNSLSADELKNDVSFASKREQIENKVIEYSNNAKIFKDSEFCVKLIGALSFYGVARHLEVLSKFLASENRDTREVAIHCLQGCLSDGHEYSIKLLLNKMIKQDASVIFNESVYKLLSLGKDAPLNRVYKLISEVSSDERLVLWRAIHVLSRIENQMAHTVVARQLDYQWSDRFLSALDAPSMREPDVEALVDAMAKSFPGMQTVALLRQTRHPLEECRRNVYVVSFFWESPKGRKFETYFAKEVISGELANQYEVEGTNLLKFFGVDNIQDMTLIAKGHKEFFIRPFMDGFDLTEKEMLLKLKEIYPSFYVLKNYAYALGKIAVQTELLGKGDFGGANELVQVKDVDGKPVINIGHIDLSSTFDLTDKVMGMSRDIYSYYWRNCSQVADLFKASEPERKRMLQWFFIGLRDQYSLLHTRAKGMDLDKDNDVDKRRLAAIRRILDAENNFLENVEAGILVNLKTAQHAELKDAFHRKMTLVDRILIHGTGKFTSDIKLFGQLVKVFERVEKVNKITFWVKEMKEISKELKMIANPNWFWGDYRFSMTNDSEIINFLQEHNIELEDLKKFSNFIKDNISSVLEHSGINIRALLLEIVGLKFS